MTRSWNNLHRSASRAAAAVWLSVAFGARPENTPVQLQVIVLGERAAAGPAASLDAVASTSAEPLAGASVRVGDVRKTTSASGEVSFTLDKRKKVRITVAATEFQTLEKRPDLSKDPLDAEAACEANTCVVRLLLKSR